MNTSIPFAELKDAILTAQRLVVLTGAGVSAESGVPTFRDALTGLWEKFDPMELATAEAFERNPALVWGWYEWRRQLLLKVKPNPAHLALARLAQQVPNLTLITQNVDDLHERAGSQQVLHLHGSMFAPRCFTCSASYSFTEPPTLTKEEKVEPPNCASCGGLIRPGVVWFGENLPQEAMNQAFAAAEASDVFLSVGTSGLVYPAAGLPEVAAQQGAKVIHINPQPQTLSYLNETQLLGKAGELLPLLVAENS